MIAHELREIVRQSAFEWRSDCYAHVNKYVRTAFINATQPSSPFQLAFFSNETVGWPRGLTCDRIERGGQQASGKKQGQIAARPGR